MDLNQIYQGDSYELLDQLENNSIDCIVTSPPYYGLRNYGNDNQIGLERTSDEYINKMVRISGKAKAKLKKEGTLWLNLGDSYNGYPGGARDGRGIYNIIQHARQERETGYGLRDISSKPKNLMGIPWRVAFALQGFAVVPMYKISQWADILKEAREKNDWELVLFVENILRSMDLLNELQNQGWYLRQDIIWHKPNPMPESVVDRCTKAHEYIFLLSKSPKYYFDHKAIQTDVVISENRPTGVARNRLYEYDSKENNNPEYYLKKSWNGSSFDKGKTGEMKKTHGHTRTGKSGNKKRKNGVERDCPADTRSNVCSSVPWEGEKANKRSVWSVNLKPFSGAHFATYPQELIVDCIKAGCPEGGVVLDLFGGAATTAIVAQKLRRNFILFELNPEYIKIAWERIRNELGFFFQLYKPIK